MRMSDSRVRILPISSWCDMRSLLSVLIIVAVMLSWTGGGRAQPTTCILSNAICSLDSIGCQSGSNGSSALHINDHMSAVLCPGGVAVMNFTTGQILLLPLQQTGSVCDQPFYGQSVLVNSTIYTPCQFILPAAVMLFDTQAQQVTMVNSAWGITNQICSFVYAPTTSMWFLMTSDDCGDAGTTRALYQSTTQPQNGSAVASSLSAAYTLALSDDGLTLYTIGWDANWVWALQAWRTADLSYNGSWPIPSAPILCYISYAGAPLPFSAGFPVLLLTCDNYPTFSFVYAFWNSTFHVLTNKTLSVAHRPLSALYPTRATSS
jgi:hypothetical protein